MSNRFHGVIIGEYGVGKTSLMYGLVGKPVPKDHIPTLMEIHCLELDQKHHLELVLTDTPGNDDYHKIAQMALISKDLVILCYSMEDNSSYHSISDKWIIKLRSLLPDIPIVLVATKSDLHPQTDPKHITRSEDVSKKAEEIGAVAFMEFCAMNTDDIHKLKLKLTTTIKECIMNKKKSSEACSMM